MIKLKTYFPRITTSLVMLLMCLGEWAQEIDTLRMSVGLLWEKGVQNSLLLHADQLREQVAGENIKVARTARLPDLQVGLKAGIVGQPIVFRRGLSSPEYPNCPNWLQNYVIDFSLPLYTGGRIYNGIRNADLKRQTASLQIKTDMDEVKLELLEQYLNFFNLYRKQRILTLNIDESQQRLQNIRKLKREGIITDNDVLRSEMQLTDDRLSLQEVDNSLTLASQQLDILIGMNENLIIIPDTTILHQAITLNPYEDYVEKAFKCNSDMEILRKQTEIAKNEVRLARALSMPEISLYASNTLARPISRTLEDMYNNNWNIGLSVSIPLSSLYKNNHYIKESKITVDIRQNEENLLMQNIHVYVKTAWLRHKEAIQRVEALRLSARQAEENYRIMCNRYFNQMVILTDLLNANSVRLDAELKLITARTAVIYTYYQLQKVCGQLQ